MRLFLRSLVQTWWRSWVVRSSVALLATYLLLGWWFARESEDRGLLDPSGHPNFWVLALGAVYLLTRVAARFLLPAFLAYVLVDRVARAVTRPSRPGRG
jgi:hypothetical protein